MAGEVREMWLRGGITGVIQDKLQSTFIRTLDLLLIDNLLGVWIPAGCMALA
jgi:hypothetical protein